MNRQTPIHLSHLYLSLFEPTFVPSGLHLKLLVVVLQALDQVPHLTIDGHWNHNSQHLVNRSSSTTPAFLFYGCSTPTLWRGIHDHFNSHATWEATLLSSRVDLCAGLLCVQITVWLPILGIFMCAHMLMHVNEQGLCDNHNRVYIKSQLWEKNPQLFWELKLHCTQHLTMELYLQPLLKSTFKLYEKGLTLLETNTWAINK